MTNEEFEFSDDISEHANLPKVLIHVPNLFTKNNNNIKHNGKLSKSTRPAVERQSLLKNKNKNNADLELPLKPLDNNNNNKNKNAPLNNNEKKHTKIHVTFSNKNKLKNSIKKTNNKISSIGKKKMPNSTKTLRNTIEVGDPLYKKKLVENEIANSEHKDIYENSKTSPNKKIHLKKDNKENKNQSSAIRHQQKSFDSKSNKKIIKQYKNIVDSTKKEKNEKNEHEDNIKNKPLTAKIKIKKAQKSEDLSFDNKNKLTKKDKKLFLRNSVNPNNSLHINSIKEFNSNSSNLVFNKANNNKNNISPKKNAKKILKNKFL
jgi:hypothetical protein